MERQTIDLEEKTDLVIKSLEIQANSISIESMLCRMIDSDIDIDWMESLLYLAQQQTRNVEKIMASDEELCLSLSIPLLSYCRAVETMSLRAINEVEKYYYLAEAILTCVRKQQYYAERLLSLIAEL